MRKHRSKKGVLSAVAAALAVLAVAIWFFAAVNRLEAGHTGEGKAQLETALRRAAVACYAAEGFYPPSLDYLTEHYGVQIDESRFTVYYDVFAENLMPDITVLEKGT